MQDEINEKVVALSVKGAKLTAEMLQKAIKAMLAQAKKQQEKQPHGKQTLKQLAKQNAGLSNIEISPLDETPPHRKKAALRNTATLWKAATHGRNTLRGAMCRRTTAL